LVLVVQVPLFITIVALTDQIRFLVQLLQLAVVVVVGMMAVDQAEDLVGDLEPELLGVLELRDKDLMVD
jgi:hypothetical protein